MGWLGMELPTTDVYMPENDSKTAEAKLQREVKLNTY